MLPRDEAIRITPFVLRQKKERGEKITMLTAYDYFTARLEDEAGVDVILVGDSLGQVVLGLPSTLPVTVRAMIHHAQAVARAKPRALVTVDMPFLSYQVSVERAVYHAGLLVKEGGAEAVKLEGGRRVEPQVRAIVGAGIPCMGHVGLEPQSVLRTGGYRVQGREPRAAEMLRRDAAALEEAGCFALVLEAIPWKLARDITAERSIPTIGIGAGPYCDGQVLVVHDLLGIPTGFTPKFVKRYAELGGEMRRAFEEYVKEVRGGLFPDLEHSYGDPRQSDAAGGGVKPPASGGGTRHKDTRHGS